MRWRLLLALVTVLPLAGCAPSRPPWAEGRTIVTPRPLRAVPQSLANLPQRALALHNHEREEVAVPPLAWDPELAAAAASYAAILVGRGALSHSPPEGRPGQGENLWMGTQGAFQIEEMIGDWAGEQRLFRAGIFPDVSSNGHWQDVAHYTQMIWRSTSRLGCAVRSGRGSDVLVCRYAPQGNVLGRPVP